MRKQQFQVGDRQVRCVPEPSRGATTGLKTARRVELPARTEVIVPCKPTHASSWLQWSAAVAQPCSNQWRYAEDGLVIGSALKTPDQPETVIPVMNLTDEPRTLYRGTRIGEVHAVTKYDRVEGQLPTMSRYECDSKDSEDEGWLRGGHVKYRRDITLQGRAAFRTTRVDIGMDPADLPEYLQPLMEGVSEDLTLRQREELAAAIYEHRDVFSSGPADMGRTGLVKHTIDTGDQRPVRLPPRRPPITKQDIEKEEVQKMLDRGVIEPCQSSWASPVVLVTKKDGTTRFCIDYRKLNDVTKKDAYPLPRIDDTLDALRGSMYFSTLDLYAGYWQVEMDQGDIDKTAFVTRQGLFRFTVMPFGLCNAPATFERLMELVLKDLNWKICLIYLDDIIVYGAGFYPALDRLKIVWKRIREANLKLNPTKCCLLCMQVPFLGHIVSRQGVGVDPAKTEAVEQWPTPTNVKDVRAFLGLASYYRRYIPGFSTVAAPLTNLTRQGVDLVWDDACEGAFQTLKVALVTAPILTYPTGEGHFVHSTDASDVGIGAVLEQKQEEGGQVAKKVIAYASKTLSDSQRRYCTTNKELLAVVMAVELFKYYLTG